VLQLLKIAQNNGPKINFCAKWKKKTKTKQNKKKTPTLTLLENLFIICKESHWAVSKASLISLEESLNLRSTGPPLSSDGLLKLRALALPQINQTLRALLVPGMCCSIQWWAAGVPGLGALRSSVATSEMLDLWQ